MPVGFCLGNIRLWVPKELLLVHSQCNSVHAQVSKYICLSGASNLRLHSWKRALMHPLIENAHSVFWRLFVLWLEKGLTEHPGPA